MVFKNLKPKTIYINSDKSGIFRHVLTRLSFFKPLTNGHSDYLDEESSCGPISSPIYRMRN
jgi:hypothetical protein